MNLLTGTTGDTRVVCSETDTIIAIFMLDPQGEAAFGHYVAGLEAAGGCSLLDTQTGDFLVGPLS